MRMRTSVVRAHRSCFFVRVINIVVVIIMMMSMSNFKFSNGIKRTCSVKLHKTEYHQKACNNRPYFSHSIIFMSKAYIGNKIHAGQSELAHIITLHQFN